MTCEGSPRRFVCSKCGWEGKESEVEWRGKWAAEHEGALHCPVCGHHGLRKDEWEEAQ